MGAVPPQPAGPISGVGPPIEASRLELTDFDESTLQSSASAYPVL